MYEISSGIQIRKTRRRLHFRSGEAEFEAKTVIAYSDKGFYTTYTFGVESVLAGLRDRITDDDELLTAACMVIDGLLAGLEGGVERP